jgi:methyl-accepting chemotaxis protein
MNIIEQEENFSMDLSSEINRLAEQIKAGNYNARLKPTQVSVENIEFAELVNKIVDIYAIEIQKVKEESYKKSMENVKECLSEYTDSINSLASGDFSRESHVPVSNEFYRSFKPYFDSTSQSINKIRIVFQILQKDLENLSNNIKQSGQDYEIDLSQYSGDYRRLAENLQLIHQLIVKGLLEAFGLINKKIIDLSSNIVQARSDVLDVAHSSEQVAKNSKAVSDNTEQSDAGVRQVLRAMEDLSVTVGDVSQKAESVSRLALDGNQMSKDGSERAKKAEEGMLHIITSTEEADHLISDMQGEMKKINDIVKLITDIANQTNLLALNAAIEAARAGDAGRGFAVVASEVKALALESRKSAEKITDMISSLQKQSQKAVNAVSLATDAVRDGNVLLSDTLGIFGRLAESVEEISLNIEQVASMNEEQAAAVEEITSSMHEVSAMLKDTANEAEESARATEYTSKAVVNLKSKVDLVSEISEEISSNMSRYIS